jgi:DNA-binding transcriptional LysR family regulator
MTSLTIQALVRRVDLFTLKLFLTAVEEGQIGRAAVREHIAPSAATKRIQDFEDLVGMKLFDRNAKGVVLSPAGEVIARHVREVFQTFDDMRRELGAFTEGFRGRVGVAAPRLLIVQFLAREIGEFTRRFPLVDVELQEKPGQMALRALAAGDIDLAVYSRSVETDETGIDTRECRSDGLVAVLPVSHPLAAEAALTLEQLVQLELIAIDPTSSIMIDLRQATRRLLGRELQVKHSVTTVETARSLVSSGLGVALQPASLMFLDDRERLATVPVQGDWAVRSYRVARIAGKPLTPSAGALVAQLTSSALMPPDTEPDDIGAITA